MRKKKLKSGAPAQLEHDHLLNEAKQLEEYFFSITPEGRRALLKAGYALSQTFPLWAVPAGCDPDEKMSQYIVYGLPN